MQTRHRVLLLAILPIAAFVFSFQLGGCSRDQGGSQVSNEDRLKQMQFRQEGMWITFYETRMISRWVITGAGIIVTIAGVLLTGVQTVILIKQGGAQYYARIARDSTAFRIDIFRGTAGLILVTSGIMLLRVDLTNPVVISTERQWWSNPPPDAGGTPGVPAPRALGPGPPPALDAPIATRPGVPELPTKPPPDSGSSREQVIADEQPVADSFQTGAKVNEPVWVEFTGKIPPGRSVTVDFEEPPVATGCCIQDIRNPRFALCRFNTPGEVTLKYTLVTQEGVRSNEGTVDITVTE